SAGKAGPVAAIARSNRTGAPSPIIAVTAASGRVGRPSPASIPLIVSAMPGAECTSVPSRSSSTTAGSLTASSAGNVVKQEVTSACRPAMADDRPGSSWFYGTSSRRSVRFDATWYAGAAAWGVGGSSDGGARFGLPDPGGGQGDADA